MSRNNLAVYIGFIIVSLCLITVTASFLKPSINKTVVFQVLQYVKK